MSDLEITQSIAIPITKMEIIYDKHIRTSYKKMFDIYKDESEILMAEVGVYEGVNSKFLLTICPKLKIYLVDSWDNIVMYTGGPLQNKEFMTLIKEIALFNLAPLRSRVVFTEKNSLEASKDYADEFFHYVYIDGDHEYEPVKRDLIAWFPKVKKGGVLGGHDVGMKEIEQALKEFIKENQIPDDKWGRDPENKEGRSDFWIYK